ncbi:MAG: FkbM family methyltransferase, partial [Armatimonadota bacterium]|nr:FkbM family methyltransferase [Armatimonadota bacterium]
VKSVSLDTILTFTGPVRLLKMDCEGSEFPILLTATKLHLVEEICGEFHEMGGLFDGNSIPDAARVEGYPAYGIGELFLFLNAAGFRVIYERSALPDGRPCNLGHFWAKRV